jgi:hypothetical protein
MEWPAFTDELVKSFGCDEDKDQTFHWDGECPGLAVRVTRAGGKAFVFNSKVRRGGRVQARITIGSVKTWNIEDARDVARRYKRLCDMGVDPRDVIAR